VGLQRHQFHQGPGPKGEGKEGVKNDKAMLQGMRKWTELTRGDPFKKQTTATGWGSAHKMQEKKSSKIGKKKIGNNYKWQHDSETCGHAAKKNSGGTKGGL